MARKGLVYLSALSTTVVPSTARGSQRAQLGPDPNKDDPELALMRSILESL